MWSSWPSRFEMRRTARCHAGEIIFNSLVGSAGPDERPTTACGLAIDSDCVAAQVYFDVAKPEPDGPGELHTFRASISKILLFKNHVNECLFVCLFQASTIASWTILVRIGQQTRVAALLNRAPTLCSPIYPVLPPDRGSVAQYSWDYVRLATTCDRPDCVLSILASELFLMLIEGQGKTCHPAVFSFFGPVHCATFLFQWYNNFTMGRLTFCVGDEPVSNLRMIERHYFKDKCASFSSTAHLTPPPSSISVARRNGKVPGTGGGKFLVDRLCCSWQAA
eukprot:SAG11_NODE_2452_length_3345_cov_3.549908_1_plen_279_part_00